MSTKLLRLAEVSNITGLSRSAIYRLIAQGQFPKPRKITPHASRWREDEVQDWIDSRPVAGLGGQAA